MSDDDNTSCFHTINVFSAKSNPEVWSVFQMPYVYIGRPATYHGRPLFKLLANLKDFGRGRIVYRTSDYLRYPGKINFCRVLLAQPLMDAATEDGNVVVEKVENSLRQRQPVNISKQVRKPDFRLVPKDEEEAFCQWDKIRDYDAAVDGERKPRLMEMPPLMRKVMERGRLRRNESVAPEEDLLLPAHKVYTGDVVIEDRVESSKLSQFIEEEFATHRDFDPDEVPEQWNLERYTIIVGVRKWAGYVEGRQWDKHRARDEAEEQYKLKRKEAANEVHKDDEQ